MDRLREMGESGNPFFNLPSRDVPIPGAGGPMMPRDESSMLSNILGGLSGLKSDATLGDVTQPSIYGGDFNAINFLPKEESELLMGPREPNELTIEDLIMRGDTNEPVTTGGENDFSYLSRGDMEVDEFGNFIKPQDRMPDSGEVDLLKLLGLR